MVRARAAGALIVLGSATPSLESYHNAKAGRYELITLHRRVLDRPMLLGSGGEAGKATREVTVIADKSLPFELVRKVMATCTATKYGKISLAVLQK